MSVLIIFAFAVLSSAVSSEDCEKNAGEKCYNDYNYFEVTSDEVCPYPVKAGSDLKITWEGIFSRDQEIKGMKADFYFGTYLIGSYSQKQKGKYSKDEVATFELNHEIDEDTPDGDYTVVGGLINSDDKQINCWTVNIIIDN